MNIGSMTTIGLIIVLAGFSYYILLSLVVHGFTYRTWIFDVVIGLGMAAALIGWIFGGSAVLAVITVVLGAAWFPFIQHELTLTGSKQLKLRVGDRLPALNLLTTGGKPVTDQDLIASAPTLLLLYRGWWCPSTKALLGEIMHDFESLHRAGLTIFAASVDDPAEAAPIQEYVGDKLTILCNLSDALLEQLGVRDQRGAPWYDRLLVGAKSRDIAMPSALVINASGKIVFIYRANRVDERARPADIIASLEPAHNKP